LRMYAERKGLSAEHISVRMRYQNRHAQDCTDCETRNGTVGEITREISITGELSEAAQHRLLEIADKCPVHNTLTGEIKVRSTLVAVGTA